jgi:hypothetical protein
MRAMLYSLSELQEMISKHIIYHDAYVRRAEESDTPKEIVDNILASEKHSEVLDFALDDFEYHVTKN